MEAGGLECEGGAKATGGTAGRGGWKSGGGGESGCGLNEAGCQIVCVCVCDGKLDLQT